MIRLHVCDHKIVGAAPLQHPDVYKRQVKGYALEDYWGTEWEKRYLDCVNDPRIEKRSVTVKDICLLYTSRCV